MGSTIWEILTKKKKPAPVPQELQIYNPIHAKIGQHVKVATIDLEQFDFAIQFVSEVKREVNGQTHSCADYGLLAQSKEKEIVKKKLRLIPNEDNGQSVLLLDLVAEFEYDKPYHEGLAWEQNNGEAKEGDATYWRVNDLRDPWKACVHQVIKGAVKKNQLTYWDFWRETKDEGDNTVLEFYIVEMDEETGFFQIWCGREIEQDRIEIL
jgi:hypothetical protein